MLRRRLEPEDKRFIELVFCIFTHTSQNLVEFGVIEHEKKAYSLPSIEVKQGESLEDIRNLGMKLHVCDNKDIQMVPIVSRVFDCFSLEKDKTLTIAYRVDIPKSHVDNKGLIWLSVNDLFDALEKNNFSKEKEHKIVSQSVHTS